MADHSHIDISILRQLLAYDPETGKLLWKPRAPSDFKDGWRSAAGNCNNWNAQHAGREAFTALSRGYLTGCVQRISLKAHRVAWAIHHGEWPRGDIDHIDGNPGNNRISNLRVVDHRTNMRNVKLRRDSTSGVQGVTWFKRRQKWMASIGGVHLGYFDTLDAARSARGVAEAERGYHENHGRAE